MRISVEELAQSLDDLFLEVAEIKDHTEAIGRMLAKSKVSSSIEKLQDDVAELKKQMEDRDRLNLLMTKHVERLTREKEFLLMHLGFESLKNKAEAERERKLQELYLKLKERFDK
jgi:hypothetical protein